MTRAGLLAFVVTVACAAQERLRNEMASEVREQRRAGRVCLREEKP